MSDSMSSGCEPQVINNTNTNDKMTDIGDKENMSPLRLRRSVSPAKTSSPPKPTKKARSKSIGPGGLEELESAKQKSPKPSRRRSAMTQIIQLPPKGILPSKDEAQKRKEARRKSLGMQLVPSLSSLHLTRLRGGDTLCSRASTDIWQRRVEYHLRPRQHSIRGMSLNICGMPQHHQHHPKTADVPQPLELFRWPAHRHDRSGNRIQTLLPPLQSKPTTTMIYPQSPNINAMSTKRSGDAALQFLP